MKTNIYFGLVYIPVVLNPSSRVDEISFNQLDKKTLSRVRYVKTCEDCDGNRLESGDIVKGYEYKKGEYVVFEDKDFERLKGDMDKSIEVDSFCGIGEIDPNYYDKHYHVVHNGNEKGFSLLIKLLESEKKVAIAKSMIGTKEKLIVLRAKNGKMLLSTLFFEHELIESKSKEITIQPTKKELELGKKLMEGMVKEFEPSEYKDEYKERLKEAIGAKIEGKEIKGVKKRSGVSAAELMEALTRSIQNELFDRKPKAAPKPKTNAVAGGKKAVSKGRVAVRAKAGRN